MNMKYIIAVAVTVALLLPMGAKAQTTAEDAEEAARQALEDGVENVLADIDLADMEALYNETVFAETMGFDAFIGELTSQGMASLSTEDLLNAIMAYLKEALTQSAVFMLRIVVILLILGVMKHLPGSEGAARAAFYAGYVICATMAATLIASAISRVGEAMGTLSSICETITPILIALLTGLGGLSSSSVMSPIMAGLTGTIFTAMTKFVFPSVIVCVVIMLCANFSSTIQLNKLASLIESAVKWFLGIVFTVFLGVSALKGLSGSTIDGLSYKTAKYTIDKMVPVIGGMFSDTLDTLMSCGLIVKNAVGTAGLIIIAGCMLVPLCSLVVNMFLFKASAALAEPFADAGAVRMLEGMANMAKLLFLTLLTCVAMAFILVALMMGAANISIMLR